MLIGQVRAIRVLCAVAERRFVLGRRRSLGITQSAVSQHVAALEREAGLPLVDRGTRPLELTEAGAVLVRHGRMVARPARRRGAGAGGDQRPPGRAAPARQLPDRAHDVRPGRRSPGCATANPDARAHRRRRPHAGAAPAARRAASSTWRWSTRTRCCPGEALGRLTRIPLFDDPYRVVLPAGHRLARRREADRAGRPGRARSGWAVAPVAPGSGSCCTPAAPPGSSRARCSPPTTTARCTPSSPPGSGIGGGPRPRRRHPPVGRRGARPRRRRAGTPDRRRPPAGRAGRATGAGR